MNYKEKKEALKVKHKREMQDFLTECIKNYGNDFSKCRVNGVYRFITSKIVNDGGEICKEGLTLSTAGLQHWFNPKEAVLNDDGNGNPLYSKVEGYGFKFVGVMGGIAFVTLLYRCETVADEKGETSTVFVADRVVEPIPIILSVLEDNGYFLHVNGVHTVRNGFYVEGIAAASEFNKRLNKLEDKQKKEVQDLKKSLIFKTKKNAKKTAAEKTPPKKTADKTKEKAAKDKTSKTSKTAEKGKDKVKKSDKAAKE